LTVASIGADQYTLTPNSGQLQWPGDSGGPCFYNNGTSYDLTGIQSGASWSCPANIPAGATCGFGPGQYATPTSASQASVQYVADWINNIINAPPTQAFVSSNFSVVQGPWGTVGNFEAVVPVAGIFGAPGQGLQHFWGNNDIAGTPWNPGPIFGTDLTNVLGAVLVASSFGTLDVVATAGSSLYYFNRDSSGNWSSSFAVPGASNQRGTPGFVQGTYGTPGNFEVAVPNASSGIDYFWRDNSTFTWNGPQHILDSLGLVDDVVLFESVGSPGLLQTTMQLAARVGGSVYTTFRDSTSGQWFTPSRVATNANGRPGFIQTRYESPGGFELMVPSTAGGFDEYTLSNTANSLNVWAGPNPVFRQSGMLFASAVVLESNIGPSPGNLEVFGNNPSTLVYGRRENTDFPTTFGGVHPDLRFMGPKAIISSP
jgi:hypothetical protein